MGLSVRLALWSFLLVLGGSGSGRILAAVDLTGRWGVQALGFGSPVTCLVDVTQEGDALRVVGRCSSVGAVEVAGTIDPGTGRFTVTGRADLCAVLAATGAAAPDGRSFGGTVSCLVGPLTVEGTFTASPCGNGTLDSGEECDDGNLLDGDCCSSACRLEGSGRHCPDDGNPCTDDTCDGHGFCEHPANPAAEATDCGVPSDLCGVGRCDRAGTCVRESRPDALPCSDGNACTVRDVCRQGECVGGPPLACGSCEVCDSETGCVPSGAPGCAPRRAVRARRFAQLWNGTVRGPDGRTAAIAWRIKSVYVLARPGPFAEFLYGRHVCHRGSLPCGVHHGRFRGTLGDPAPNLTDPVTRLPLPFDGAATSDGRSCRFTGLGYDTGQAGTLVSGDIVCTGHGLETGTFAVTRTR